MKQEQGLENLTVWRKAMDFAVWVCKVVVPQLPKDERYALNDQLRRAVQSIPANIAEEYGRFYFLDNIRFCYIARGSLEETRSHLIFAKEMGYLSNEIASRVFEEMGTIRRLINGYIAYLKTSRPGSQEPGAALHEETPEYSIADNPFEATAPE